MLNWIDLWSTSFLCFVVWYNYNYRWVVMSRPTCIVIVFLYQVGVILGICINVQPVYSFRHIFCGYNFITKLVASEYPKPISSSVFVRYHNINHHIRQFFKQNFARTITRECQIRTGVLIISCFTMKPLINFGEARYSRWHHEIFTSHKYDLSCIFGGFQTLDCMRPACRKPHACQGS